MQKLRKKDLSDLEVQKAKKELIIFTILFFSLSLVIFLTISNNLGSFMFSIRKILCVIDMFFIGNIMYLGNALYGGKEYESYF